MEQLIESKAFVFILPSGEVFGQSKGTFFSQNVTRRDQRNISSVAAARRMSGSDRRELKFRDIRKIQADFGGPQIRVYGNSVRPDLTLSVNSRKEAQAVIKAIRRTSPKNRWQSQQKRDWYSLIVILFMILGMTMIPLGLALSEAYELEAGNSVTATGHFRNKAKMELLIALARTVGSSGIKAIMACVLLAISAWTVRTFFQPPDIHELTPVARQ